MPTNILQLLQLFVHLLLLPQLHLLRPHLLPSIPQCPRTWCTTAGYPRRRTCCRQLVFCSPCTWSIHGAIWRPKRSQPSRWSNCCSLHSERQSWSRSSSCSRAGRSSRRTTLRSGARTCNLSKYNLSSLIVCKFYYCLPSCRVRRRQSAPRAR